MNSTPPTTNRWRRLALRLSLTACSVLITLLFLEVGLRVAGIAVPNLETGSVPHPTWHHWHQPNHEFQFTTRGEGLTQPIHFNEHGMRMSRVVPFAKPAGATRIAVIGDSFTEAMQVTERQGFVGQLESILNSAKATHKRHFEVLNFGVSGASTSMEYVLLRDFVLKFDPDQVVLLHHFTDMTEDSLIKGQARYNGQELVAIGRSGQSKSRRIRNFLRGSRLFSLCEKLFHDRRAARRSPPPADASLQATFDAIVHDPYTAQDNQAWRYSLGFLDRIASLLASKGVAFHVVQIPIGTQVEPVPKEWAAQSGLKFLAAGRRLEYQGYQQRLSACCHLNKIVYLDLLPAFRSANPTGQPHLYLTHDQHWTAAGHALAARTVATEIQAVRKR